MMNKQAVINLLKDHSLLTQYNFEHLYQLSEQYPHFKALKFLVAKKAQQSKGDNPDLLHKVATGVNNRHLLYRTLLLENPDVYYEQVTQDYFASLDDNTTHSQEVPDDTPTEVLPSPSEKLVFDELKEKMPKTQEGVDYQNVLTEDLTQSTMSVISQKQVEYDLEALKNDKEHYNLDEINKTSTLGEEALLINKEARKAVLSDLENLKSKSQKGEEKKSDNKLGKTARTKGGYETESNDELIESIKDKIARFNKRKQAGVYNNMGGRENMSEEDIKKMINADKKNLSEIHQYMDETYGGIKEPKPSFNPQKNAQKSSKVELSDATETLAKVYEKQGAIHKAIEVYKQLSLKFPEKSAYFADRIDLLKKMS